MQKLALVVGFAVMPLAAGAEDLTFSYRPEAHGAGSASHGSFGIPIRTQFRFSGNGACLKHRVLSAVYNPRTHEWQLELEVRASSGKLRAGYGDRSIPMWIKGASDGRLIARTALVGHRMDPSLLSIRVYP